MRLFLLLSWLAAAILLSAAEKPNILVVLTDDLGFSDIGCYGSEIQTPVLDKLAANGLRFSQFYNTAKCHSSRVSLLSGRWCRQAGDESLKRAVIIPEVLRPAGYSTLMSGKWHLSKEPTDFGFERYFGHLSGACSFFKGDNTFRLDGQPWKVPDSGFYTTIAKVDFALKFLADARKEEKPWFLYLAFNAPHAPIHALEQDYRKYRDHYAAGWDVIHQRRVRKLSELGILDAQTEVSPRPDHIPAWSELPAGLQDWEIRRMAGYAGMIDRVDQELGRIVADLGKSGELDNTLIIFLSDNGACPYDRQNEGWESEPYDPKTRWTDSTGWAWARNAPFRFYKQNQYEGGIATPAVFHWPAGLKTDPGSLNHTPAHLVDLLPTLAEISDAEIPDSFPGREPTPLAGVSLAPVLAGGALPSRPPLHFLHDRDRGLRDGDWKIVSFREGPWELYHIGEDRREIHDLAAKHPERVARMAAEWHRMTRDVLMAPAREQRPVSSEANPKVHPEWSNYHQEPGRHTGNR
jgi:arylsulfatase A-like enzyme